MWMNGIRVGVEGLGAPSVVAERVDEWRRTFAPAGSTVSEKIWVTSAFEPTNRARNPSPPPSRESERESDDAYERNDVRGTAPAAEC